FLKRGRLSGFHKFALCCSISLEQKFLNRLTYYAQNITSNLEPGDHRFWFGGADNFHAIRLQCESLSSRSHIHISCKKHRMNHTKHFHNENTDRKTTTLMQPFDTAHHHAHFLQMLNFER